MSTNERSLPARIWHFVSGRLLLAPGEVVGWVSGLSHASLAWGSIALAAVILLSSNLVVSRVLRDWRSDFTQDRLFTISPATRSVLATLDEPIALRMYFSKKLGEASPQHLKMFERVRSLLEQYASQARGKIDLKLFNPEPFSDAEDRAQAGGLTGRPLGEGDQVYFGLVAQNRTDQQEILEFFSQERERFLEYDLTKMIHVLSNPRKRVVGLISSLPVDGGGPQNPMMPQRRGQQPMIVVEQMKEFFTVKTIAPDITAVPADVDVLMLIQPSGLTKQSLYAIDQFALKGGRILAFVDPNAELAQMGGMPGMMMGGGAQVDAGFVSMMSKSWGVEFDPTKVATDYRHALRLESGTNPAWFTLGKDAIPQLDVLAADIKTMIVASPGAVAKAVGATTDFQPLLEIPQGGALVPADRFIPGMIGRHTVTEADLKPSRKSIALGARIAGTAKSAFPDGRPKAEAPKEEKQAEKKADAAPKSPAPEKAAAPAPAEPAKKAPEKSAAAPVAKAGPDAKTIAPGVKVDTAPSKAEPAPPKADAPPKAAAKQDPSSGRPTKDARTAETTGAGAAKDQAPAAKGAAPKSAEPAKQPAQPKADDKSKDAAKDAKQPEKAAAPEAPHLASGNINVVVVADTDFLQNPLWVDVQQQRNGQLVATPLRHNGAFVINALENLAGGTAFLGLRGRGVSDRPFDTVEQIKREAELKYRAEEKRLEARFKELQKNLSNVTVKGDGQVLLSEKEHQAIDNFKSELTVIRRRLRELQLAQRQDINDLQWWVTLLNIAAMPLLIGGGAIAMMIMRRRRKMEA